jgi:flavorubredoxin
MSMTMPTVTALPTLPREIAPGIHWLAGCNRSQFHGRTVHNHNALYVIQGRERSAIYDTGQPSDWQKISAQLDKVVGPEPAFIFPSHPEGPHGGNLLYLLERFPRAQVIGDLRDYHLYFPELVDRFVDTKPGDSFDLGGTSLVVLDALLQDLTTTLWGYDTDRQVLFVSDGLPFTHSHDETQCALTSTEIPAPPTFEEFGIFIERAFYWSYFVDADPAFDRLSALMERYPTRIVAPAHSNVIVDPERLVPSFREIMKQARKTEERGRDPGDR